jgi:hypothetical protein
LNSTFFFTGSSTSGSTDSSVKEQPFRTVNKNRPAKQFNTNNLTDLEMEDSFMTLRMSLKIIIKINFYSQQLNEIVNLAII